MQVGIPQHKFAKLRYVDLAQGNTFLANMWGWTPTYLLNGPYDPRFDQGPNQLSAQYYATFSNQYNIQRTVGCKIITRAWNTGDEAVRIYHVCSNQQILTAFGSQPDPRVLQSNPWVFTQEIAPSSAQGRPTVFTKYIPLHKLAGRSKIAFAVEDQWESVVNTTPLNLLYYLAYVKGVGSAGGLVYTTTTIVYYIKFSDRVMVTVQNQADVPYADIPVWDIGGSVVDGPTGPTGIDRPLLDCCTGDTGPTGPEGP